MKPLVDVELLANHLDDAGWIVFDCRHDLAAPAAGEAEYRVGHIPGARFAALERDLSGPKVGESGRHPLPTPEHLVAFLSDAGVHDHTTIVAYDAGNGLYASRLWWLARWIGHERVAVLDGGLAAWIAAGLPVTDAIPKPAPGNVRIAPSVVAHVDTADLVANLSTGEYLVVDARAPERFRGDVEPLDPVAGHIPGAVNRPMAASLESDGRFRPAAALREGFEQLLGVRPPESLVHSCGSGVTACHNLLAMEVAGLPGSALYPGSWSAWSANPERPVATGG